MHIVAKFFAFHVYIACDENMNWKLLKRSSACFGEEREKQDPLNQHTADSIIQLNNYNYSELLDRVD